MLAGGDSREVAGDKRGNRTHQPPLEMNGLPTARPIGSINRGLSLGRVRVDRGNARDRLSRPDLSGTQAKV